MNVKTILIETDDSGNFTYSRHFVGQILGVKVSVGTMTASAATPDFTLSDVDQSVDLIAVTGLSADAYYQPVVTASGSDGDPVDTTGDVAYVAPVIIGSLGIAIANSDPGGKGYVRLVLS